ncbi:mechanosensitive ion channel, partial [bacterium]|nr:mechanosensitive ion channel [bacterium]
QVLSRLEIDPSMRVSLGRIIFYSLITIFTLFTLHFLNVPITIFTVLSGALALGVGFGSQAIVSNFISGLIIMAERPVRIGDAIEVDGLNGVVEEIGTRSTKIKSLSNTHIIIPNSTLLEKNVLNWTLSNDIIRSSVTVGVSYGSPAEKVKEILLKVAEDNKKVLDYPQPTVLFSDFGDNSLAFDLYCYSQIRNLMQLKELQSDLRFSIYELLAQDNITIAFPQRDVHLDTLKPLQVEVMK